VETGPIVGIAAARQYIEFFRDPIGCMRRIYDRRGPVAMLGPIAFGEPRKPEVVAIGPDYNRQILGDPSTFRTTGQFLRGPEDSAQRRLRYGLTRMIGSEHKRQRQLVMPPFHKKAVEGYHDTMIEVVQSVTDQWKTGGRHDVHLLMRRLTLRISSAILFSRDPVEAVTIGNMLEEWQNRNFSPLVWLLPVDLPGTAFHRLLQHAVGLEKEILAMIQRRRANLDGNTDVLSLLIQARDDESQGMTDAELVGQSAILFGASFETTASTLTWTLFLLSQHPEVMGELMTELDTVLGGAEPSRDQLNQLPFLERVIKESMRILPPVPFTIRAATRNTSIGPYPVPKGSRVICSHYLTHHLPEIYPEPEHFRPERWRTIDPNQYEYMPFSAGPRACIGAMFAMQALKVSLALMLQKFRFTLVPGTRIDRDVRITMVPRHGMPMSIFPNDRQYEASKVTGQVREMVALP
jgi:cytochrome P450